MPLWKRNLFVCWFGSFITTTGMSLVIPFLPLFIEQLGIHSLGAIEQWSGLAFGSTFLLAAIVSPLWGRLADTHGRKLMLLRASLGMALITTLMGFSQNVYQLVGLRLLMGAVSGYISAAITLVATQTPKESAGWALGTLSTGSVGGTLLGPLIGGYLVEVIGLRHVFFVTGFVLFGAFLVTLLMIQESFTAKENPKLRARDVWRAVPDMRQLLVLFLTSFMLQVASMSIEPIVTVYVKQLLGVGAHVALIAGAVVAASGLAMLLAAPRMGKLADRMGPRRVLLGALVTTALLSIPQAFVTDPWQLMGLRFAMGVSAAGLLPSVNTLVKCLVPESISGRIYGYNQSAQYLGNISGPLLGGQMAAGLGIRSVFFSTSALLFCNALWVAFNRPGENEQPAG